jgi:PDZ domain-containing secreted protein
LDDKHPLASFVAKLKVGDEITLKVSHKGEQKDVKVKLEAMK